MTNWFAKAWGLPGDAAFRMGPSVTGPNQAMATAMKNVARFQLECWALSSRRAQAYLELPGRLARCTTPDALAKEQMRFLETAAHQYADSTKRLTHAWQATMTLPRATALNASNPIEAAAAEVHSLPGSPSRPAVEMSTSKPLRIGAPTAAAPEERRKVA